MSLPIYLLRQGRKSSLPTGSREALSPISNLGGIGGVFFTPILNPPEVAILGVSRSSVEPAYVDGEFVPKLMLPLSLSL